MPEVSWAYYANIQQAGKNIEGQQREGVPPRGSLWNGQGLVRGELSALFSAKPTHDRYVSRWRPRK